jgi:carbohydrate kinase (thermoresistant glucokinase family)
MGDMSHGHREPEAVVNATSSHPLVVVMGVSGAGKSTIGVLVAHALNVRFVDGDSLHPIANVAKMAAGTPLDDDDRWPWLAVVGRTLADAAGEGLVVACSALKRAYRDAIRAEVPEVIFLHLDGSHAVLSRRMEGRTDHFMPTSLLESQLSTLERLQPDEHGVVVDIDAPVSHVVAAAADAVVARVARTV